MRGPTLPCGERRIVSRALVTGARLRAALAACCTCVTLLAVQPASDQRAPDLDLSTPAARASLLGQIRDNVWRDRILEEQYTYVERRRDVRISKMGKVSLGPVRTFEVYPSTTPGRTYKRLTEIEGVPLGAEELARRDAEHLRNMVWEKQRREHESADQRAQRERRDAERDRRQRREFEEAFAAFDIAPAGYESREGYERPLLRLTLTPRPQAPASSDLVRYLKRFKGTAWIDPVELQLARLDLEAAEAVSVGWGVVGRINPGSRAWYERRKVGDLWLPAWARAQGRGRTLLFRSFELDVEWTWSDYRKYSVEARIIDGPKGQ